MSITETQQVRRTTGTTANDTFPTLGKVQDMIGNVTTVNAATYDLLVTDYILHVTYTATGAVTINLPSAQALSGRIVRIKDAGGNAGVNNILVNAQSGGTIDGLATATINANYDSMSIYSAGSNTWFIF